MSKLKTTMALKREIKKLKAELDQKESTIALLRFSELERTTEFVNQMQLIFGLVDYIFYDADTVRTLGEAKSRWEEFKKIINESESAEEALTKLDIEIEISRGENEKIVINSWEESRKHA